MLINLPNNRTQAYQPALRPARAEAPVAAEQQPFDMVDMLPSNWQDIDTQEVVLPKSTPPKLNRPVIFLHGFNGSAERWSSVTDWLTSGDSGNKYGGILDAGKFDNIDPQSNLFSLRLSRPFNSVEKNKAELKEAVEAVVAATGSSEVDLVVHSLGGLNSRAYLQDADEKVNKLVQLGTPNHGSQLANMELFMRENFDYPVIPKTDDPEVRRVLEQLSVDKNDGNGNAKNPWLRALNNDWDNQRGKADVMVVAGAGVPTLTGGPGITALGDGVVTRRSAKLDGVENKTIWFKTHGGLQNSAKVMENMAKFLTGQSLPSDENLFDRPEDAVRAAQLLNKESTEVQPGKPASAEEVKRAVRLPLLDPAFQIGLGLGVLSSILGGPKEVLPLVEIALSSENSQNEVHADYDIDLQRAENPVIGSGSVNNTSFAEVANLKEGKVYWNSALNLKSSSLVMEVGEDEQSVLMKGQLGGVPTDLTLSIVKDDKGRITGMQTVGKFNEEPYNVSSSLNLEGLILGGGAQHHSDMHVTGVVNGENLDRTYQVKVKRNRGNLELSAHHQPNTEDQQMVGVDVKVKERS